MNILSTVVETPLAKRHSGVLIGKRRPEQVGDERSFHFFAGPMYLSKLELHGFKSFATPTVLSFDPGITAIVGPNGCGKSNIVDAVRWVIGEQRARVLRSEKMDNVIFNGTSKRRPFGLAEVLLTVENTRGILPTEYAEVTLGRRLYRSGDSEYLLNGTPCRLRDIVDLFMDTGMGAGAYSVIELKMIEEILSDNTYERRHLFEEAAGITKYKQRRTQALRKLDNTQADLTRLRDLTEEIEKRVRSLERQAAKATRYKAYEARLHQLELALARVEYDRLTEQEHLLQMERQGLQDALEEHTARLAKDEAAMEALRKTLIEQEQRLSENQQQLNEHLGAVRDLEADARLERERLDGATRDHDRTEREQADAQQQRAERAEAIDTLTARLGEAEPVQQSAERVFEEAQAARGRARAAAEARREALRDLRRREQQGAEERADYHRRLDRLTNRDELLGREGGRVRAEIETLRTMQGELQALTREAAHRKAESATALAQARTALAETQREHEAGRQRLEAATDALRQTERQHDAVAAEVQLLDGLVSSFDEFPDAVRFLAANPSWTLRPLKTVADVLTCEAVHRMALDAALGSLADCLIVETAHEARQAAALLRSEQKGRATFLVLDRLPYPPPSRAASDTFRASGIPMGNLVRVSEPACEPLAAVLLEDTYFVEALDEAEAVAEQAGSRARYVTGRGEWMDTRGLVYTGDNTTEASPMTGRMERREQLDAVRERLEHLKEAVEQQGEAVDALRTTLSAVPLEARHQALTKAEQAFGEAERDHERRLFEQEALQRRQADLAGRLAAFDAERQTVRGEFDASRAAVADAETRLDTLRLEREAADAAFQDAEAESRAAQDHLEETHIEAVEARNRCDNLRRDLARTRHEVETLERRVTERREHLEALRHTIDSARERQAQLAQDLDAVRTQRTGLEAAVAEAKTALFQTKVDIDRVEVRLRKLRQAREETMREDNVRAVRQAEIQTRKDDLIENIREGFGVALGVDSVEVEEGFEEAAARDEVQALREKIKGMGSVNALALEEYEAEKERYDFMAAQKEDLEHAEATLLETIEEINTTAALRFMETYTAIRASFVDLFTELFGQDAGADLQLTDPEDPLESPIDIMAKPRGKRPIHIAQLSSGEKTLTAIALLFAIYLVKPSPFCILDEVDAPLDDANIDRFMRLIRRFAGHTQFILVTHNKRTMELADRLYGITMQEQGVSRLVGVKFEEALALAS